MPFPPNYVPLATREPGFRERKWHPVAVCIASGMTSKSAAEQHGLSQATVGRWRQSPKFQAYVNKLHDEAIEQAIGKLASVMCQAAEVVIELLVNPDPDIRLKAVDRVEKWVKQFRNDKLVLQKLEQLEAKLPVAVVHTGGE